MIGSVSASSVGQVARQLGQLTITDKPAAMTPTTTSSDPAPSTDVNMVQTSKSSRRKTRINNGKNHLVSRTRPILRKTHRAKIRRERRKSNFHA
jgi:hypothetical protein